MKKSYIISIKLWQVIFFTILNLSVMGVTLITVTPITRPMLSAIIGQNPAPELDLNVLSDDVNKQRIQNNLPALVRDPRLDNTAQIKCNDIIAKDYWSHTSPTGDTPWDVITSQGVYYLTAGENLAYGFVSSFNVVDGWMKSPGHRENILNSRFTNVGYAQCKYGKDSKEGEQTVIVQHLIQLPN